MGRKFHCFDKQRDVKTQTCNFKKTYKTIFCLKCFNETQGEVVNWKNLFKQAVSSYGIPTSCFKTLSHLRGPCKLHCHVEKDLSNQNLNLLKLSKYIRLSKYQHELWIQSVTDLFNYRDIRIKSLGVTAQESCRLTLYRNKVLEANLFDDVSQTVTVNYNTNIENERDEDDLRQRDALIPSRRNVWTRVRQILYNQQRNARERQEFWRQTHLSDSIENVMIQQEMVQAHDTTRLSRREDIEALIDAPELETLTGRIVAHP